MKEFFIKVTLLVSLLGIFNSCNKKEDPSTAEVTVLISGLELLDPVTFPSSKIASQKSWIHPMETKLSLSFESTSGEKFSLEINPNDFTKPYSIKLPLGNYLLKGNSTLSDPFYSLPIRVNQNLSINKQDQNVVLNGTSDYGLFTITNKNLGANEPTILSTNQKLKLKDGFYYGYASNESSLQVKIPLADQKSSFNFLWEPKAFTHRHIGLDNPSDPEDLVTFISTDFKLEQSQISLAENGIPVSLSPRIITALPLTQNENSGLAFIQNRLFSINDGGNSSEIFELDQKTGEVIRIIKVTNAQNNDWEDLAQSETDLFIGDFGNNNGTRKDLAILKIPISSILASNEVTAQVLKFAYSDQTDFTGNGGNHNFDCEAFFFSSNQLHLFTKNRGDQKTKHYTVNPSQSTGLANLSATFDVKGLITAAGIDNQGNICLLGYEDAGFTSRSFVWLFSSYTGTNYFSGKSTRIFLGSPSQLSQTEGLIFDQNGQTFISGERITLGAITIPAQLSKIDLRGLF